MNHGIVLGGYYSTTDYFMSRSPGSYRIATFCRSINWDVEVIDYVSHWDRGLLMALIVKIIKEKDTKWIGISYNWLTEFNEEIINFFSELRKQFPRLKLIVGGQSPYNVDLNAHWYVFGYGEEALQAILDFEFGTGPLPVSETMFGGRFINAVKDYKSISSKVFNIEYSERDFLNSSDVVSLELSRGCKFKCRYCNYPFIGLKDDTSTSEEILYKELNENYQKWGIKQYMIADDTYNDRMEKLFKLRNVVKKLDFEPNFFSFIRADLLATTPDMIKVLTESRVWGHYYGIETFNRKAGIAIGKGMDPNRIKDTILFTKDYMMSNINAYRGTIGLIAGLPYEDARSWEETETWTRAHWSDQARIWWPLQIAKDKTNLSAFGKDLAAYGYREMSESRKLVFKHKTSTKDVVWENDYTNVFEATEWTSQYRESPQPIDSMSIPSWVSMFGIDYALNKRSNQRIRFYEPEYKEAADRHIKNYIMKKTIGLFSGVSIT